MSCTYGRGSRSEPSVARKRVANGAVPRSAGGSTTDALTVPPLTAIAYGRGAVRTVKLAANVWLPPGSIRPRQHWKTRGDCRGTASMAELVAGAAPRAGDRLGDEHLRRDRFRLRVPYGDRQVADVAGGGRAEHQPADVERAGVGAGRGRCRRQRQRDEDRRDGETPDCGHAASCW